MIAFTLLGFSLIAALVVYLAVLDGRRWRKKIETALLPMGFEVCLSKDEKEALAQRLLMVNPRHQGKRLLLHLYRRASPDGGHCLYFCDYRFASAGGRTGGAQWLLVCLISRELNLPRLCVESLPEASGIAGKLFKGLLQVFPMPGLERIKTGDAALDERLCIHADSGQVQQALPLLGRITAALRASGGACLDARGDCLILSSIEMGADLVRHEVDPQKLSALIHLASGLFKTLRH